MLPALPGQLPGVSESPSMHKVVLESLRILARLSAVLPSKAQTVRPKIVTVGPHGAVMGKAAEVFLGPDKRKALPPAAGVHML